MNKKVNDFSSLFSDELKDIAYRLHSFKGKLTWVLAKLHEYSHCFALDTKQS